MKALLVAGALAMLAAPVVSIGQSNFDGTWKVDFNATMPKKVNVWLLRSGIYKCTSCNPTVDVKADGKDQPVKGHPYDTISVKIVDARTVEEIEKKNGSVVSDEKFTVSPEARRLQTNLGTGS